MAKKRLKKRKIFTALAFIALLVGLAFFLFSGDNREVLLELVNENLTRDEIQETLRKLGFKGYFTIGILSMLQVILTFLPAEPVQMMAGVAFGLWRGGLICLAGAFVGNTIIFILYKNYGDKMEDFFVKNAEFDFDAARNSPKIALIVFILYFLPAIPYGLICIFTASLNAKYPKYIILTTLGSIPSILIGVGLGHIAIASSWIVSICVFAVIIVLLVLMYIFKKALFKKVNDFMKKQNSYSSKTVVRKGSKFIARLVAFVKRFILDTKVKQIYKREVEKLDMPCIVLCTHGSAYDFLYMGKMLLKEDFNIVAARLYFYNKRLGNLIRRAGGFPKSMFSTDIENVKNCMRVISAKRILVMMPEARLSTVGKFEGIQDATYHFIQRMNVPVYTMRLDGSYLACSKWCKKKPKGGLVEITLSPLFKTNEVKALGLDEIKQRVNNALYYDEFAWLEKHPEVHYKSKILAEGLENVLYLCPKCGAKHAFKTNKLKIFCSKCGFERTLNSRYAFTVAEPFKNFADWYDWQASEMEKEIRENPDFRLESHVTLMHSSLDGKKMLREAGNGICTLDKTGLTYSGEEDGNLIEKHFSLSEIYRLLFGAGEDFEIYEGDQIYYFIPDDRRSCVMWYVASGLLKNIYG